MNWTIERLGRRGDGVALREDERALAPLTLPGEEIAGEAIEGRIAQPKIVTPSPDRVRPICAHYRACGGCSLMHASEGFTAEWKAQVVAAALAAHGIETQVDGVDTSPLNSRRRAVLSGKRTKKGALLGFHARASGVIVDMAECHILHPAIVAALPLLRRLVVTGASRQAELSLTVIHTPEGLDVTVAGGKPMDPPLFAALAALAEEGDLARLTWDGESITRRAPALPMGRTRMVPPPAAFLQATAQGEAALLSEVRRITRDAQRIADLFAGCGTFTLPLAEGSEVHAVEGMAEPLHALDSAWRSGQGLRKVTTEIRDLARRPLLADELAQFDAIVIDPPRAGAAAQVARIAEARVPLLAFVACDPVNFAKDARILADAGYQIESLRVVDQFRFSPHVEIVAQFTLA
ncbi:class I SAM-dependent RNA methyltransferase [Paracoccus sp. 1_MG-2023]|uniref:class I SAM-dependent RNA methyltransferase n=1 Tax=unclassified Paracoccus (in: a-proteobacteria) TaxID=2688777 RepID=UPI001C09B9F1|nr:MULTISPECIES: class I SAM-dependent RNA methyltransferase [unclassified Paracoccus (in: a-proteobacteria)]MBU2957041.1 class I SAM-dependent RNA methyltransferase [Paracoccus sp. C2R09]MDO6668239.1 class I SAM-dependent RNA methyltransferase [Paracoccus sp. 1_MG-2023]